MYMTVTLVEPLYGAVEGTIRSLNELADKCAATMEDNRVGLHWNLKGMFATPCRTYAIKD